MDEGGYAFQKYWKVDELPVDKGWFDIYDYNHHLKTKQCWALG